MISPSLKRKVAIAIFTKTLTKNNRFCEFLNIVQKEYIERNLTL
jgi:hypothetical protein